MGRDPEASGVAECEQGSGTKLSAFFVSAEVLQLKPRDRLGLLFVPSSGNVGMPRAVASSGAGM